MKEAMRFGAIAQPIRTLGSMTPTPPRIPNNRPLPNLGNYIPPVKPPTPIRGRGIQRKVNSRLSRMKNNYFNRNRPNGQNIDSRLVNLRNRPSDISQLSNRSSLSSGGNKGSFSIGGRR